MLGNDPQVSIDIIAGYFILSRGERRERFAARVIESWVIHIFYEKWGAEELLKVSQPHDSYCFLWDMNGIL